MKKIISLLLAVMLVISAVPMAYAADTQDYSLGTAVKYTATNNENYTITVPAKLAPGDEGTVTLDGFWASNTVVTVTAEENVVLTNSINANDKKTLDVYFDGISEAGDNNGKQTFTAPVSVEGISNALFGTWNGKFNYNVEYVADSGDTDDDEIVASEGYATFSDGVTLSWEELMLEENGKKYGYGAMMGDMYLGTGIDESSIAQEAFGGCTSLTGIAIPDSCSMIDESAFSGCSSLTTVYIPDSIMEIRDRTFAGCSSLTSIDIHSGITSIHYYAFSGCRNLSTINYAGTIAQWNNITKLDYWNLDCGEITVHCTDGTLIETPSSLED